MRPTFARVLRKDEFPVAEYPTPSQPTSSRHVSHDGAALPEIVHALARRRTHRRRIRLTAAVGDVLIVMLAFALAAMIRNGDPLDIQARNTISVIVPAYLLLALTQHAFTMPVISRARIGVLRTSGALVLAIGLMGLVVFFLQAVGGVSRIVVSIGTLMALGGFMVFRTWLALHAHWLLGDVSINEVVIQDGVKARMRPGGILLDAARDGIALRLDSPAMLDRLGRCLESADRVIVACLEERRGAWVSALKSSDINAEIMAEELDEIGAIGLGSYNGHTTLTVAAAPLNLGDQLLKRALDLGFVLVSLPVLSPLMLIVAIAIKLDSKGPVFFRQPRVGLGNRVFNIYKFRSMRVAQNDLTGSQSTSRTDARITRIGAFIRKTSIDEMPQILNVLIGDMSIVGPRPHPLESKAADRLFWDIDGRYWHRHAVKPGMTGLAQVRGFRGATEKEDDLTNRLQADLEYVAGWSIWRDVGIIIATFRVLTHKNAF